MNEEQEERDAEGMADNMESPIERVGEGGDTAIIITIKEADGGLILKCDAPKERYHCTAVVAGRFDSANSRTAVKRKLRGFIADWLA